MPKIRCRLRTLLMLILLAAILLGLEACRRRNLILEEDVDDWMFHAPTHSSGGKSRNLGLQEDVVDWTGAMVQRYFGCVSP